MISLPVCKWRSTKSDYTGFHCKSPMLVVNSKLGVSLDTCAKCTHANKDIPANLKYLVQNQHKTKDLIPRPKQDLILEGPGTELEILLSKSFGVQSSLSGCSCKAHVQQMNKWGITGCEENKQTIITWLKKELDKQQSIKTPTNDILEAVLTDLVDTAISRFSLKLNKSVPNMKWMYGLTTVPGRRSTLLPKTLASLAKAGFPAPRLFVDGHDSPNSWAAEFQCEVSVRTPNIRTFGNWMLGLAELYIRDANADRYAMFQDDFITYSNLREYLERVPFPQRGYCNLYTFPQNQSLAPKNSKGGTVDGWYKSNQLGKGAVALVFDNLGVVTLLTHMHTVQRPKDLKRGHQAIDGGIVSALRKADYYEYVHSPSLVQHTGYVSSMGNKQHPQAESFRGEDFNILSLLG